MKKYFIIKYVDQEVEVTEDELKNLYAQWNKQPIALRPDGSALTDRFIHILPSKYTHFEDNKFDKLPEHEETEEEKEKRRKVWEEQKKKLSEKLGWDFDRKKK